MAFSYQLYFFLTTSLHCIDSRQEGYLFGHWEICPSGEAPGRFVHPGRPRGSNNWVEMSGAAHYWAQVHLPQSDLPEDPAKKSDLTRDMDLNKNVCGSLSLLEDRAHKPQSKGFSKKENFTRILANTPNDLSDIYQPLSRKGLTFHSESIQGLTLTPIAQSLSCSYTPSKNFRILTQLYSDSNSIGFF